MKVAPVTYIREMKMLTKFWLENLNLRIRRRCEDNIKINLIIYDGKFGKRTILILYREEW
jgi:hypothetical protein